MLSLALALVLAGCGDATPNTERSRTMDGLTAVLAVEPASPRAMQPVVLELTLRGERGEAVEGAGVQFDLTMPGMTMPKDSLAAVADGLSAYRAQTLFSMSGDWRIEARVTSPRGTTAFSYDIKVK